MTKTLLEKCKDFEKLQRSLSKFGASDSEPNSNFRRLLSQKIRKGQSPSINNEDWELYDIPGTGVASQRLSNRMKTLLNKVDKSSHVQVVEVTKWYGLDQY